MSEITLHDPSATTSFLPSEHVAARVWRLAEKIARTEFVPGSLRGKPEAILAAMLTGREIGIGAMHSLRAIDVIDGRPSLSPELLHALALREGHDLDVEESTRETCTVAVRRHDWPEDRVRRVTFDEVDARLAGLVGQECKPAEGVHPNTTTTRSGNPTCGCKQGYRTYPRPMYRSRAIAEACRTYLPDVVERIGYTAEELGGEDPTHADAVETVREALGDEVADAAAEQLADDEEVLEAEVVKDDDPDDAAPADPAPEPDTDPGANDVAPPAEPAEDVCAHTVRDTIDTRGASRCRRCGQVFRPADDAPPFDTDEPETLAETAARDNDSAGDRFVPGTRPEQGVDLERLLAGSVPEIVAAVARQGLDHAEVWTAEEALAARENRDARKTLRRSLGVEDRASRDETPAETEAPVQAAPAPQATVHVPEGMDPAEVEYRRTVLKRYRTVYREVYDRDQQAAARLHALRLETVGSTDEAALWVERKDVERFEQGIAKIRGEVFAPAD